MLPTTWSYPVLPRAFYSREPETVARELIGKHLVRVLHGEVLAGRIVEAEAYHGPDDAASHARSGRTSRTYPMFGPPGHSYVYFIYGMHWMFNIAAHRVAGPDSAPKPSETGPSLAGAVLIRALEPVVGLDRMQALRGGRGVRELTNGPARLAQALAISAELNDVDLCTGSTLTVTAGTLRPNEAVASGPRVRIPGDAPARTRPWRFWIAGNAYVSS